MERIAMSQEERDRLEWWKRVKDGVVTRRYAAEQMGVTDRWVPTLIGRFGEQGASFTAGKPRVWTEARIQSTGFALSYDIAPDGKRLPALVADAESEKLPTRLTFLLNFSDELRQAPVAKYNLIVDSGRNSG